MSFRRGFYDFRLNKISYATVLEAPTTRVEDKYLQEARKILAEEEMPAYNAPSLGKKKEKEEAKVKRLSSLRA